MEPINKEEKLHRLYRLMAQITDEEDFAALFDDLCTRKEVENMAERLYAAQLLLEGTT